MSTSFRLDHPMCRCRVDELQPGTASTTRPLLEHTDAELSPCATYRYSLVRRFQGDGPAVPLAFVMLNPSTADWRVNDPTVRKCVGFALRYGHREVRVVNLYALRSTDPSALRRHHDPVGPDNDAAIERAARDVLSRGGHVVAAWGAVARGDPRADAVRRVLTGLGPLYRLRLLAGDVPGHPLMLPYSDVPRLWARRDGATGLEALTTACCVAERRTAAGGCATCGDPCL